MSSVRYQLGLLNEIPENGIAIFAGDVSNGKNSTKKFTRVIVDCPVPISKSLYHCDGRFHTEHLRSDLVTHMSGNKVGFIIVDGHHSVLAVKTGREKALLHEWKGIFLPRKHSKGGQSAARFEHIRVEKRHVFCCKLAEICNRSFLDAERKPIVQALVIAGPGYLKNEFMKADKLDYRLRKVVVRPYYDIPYGGIFGLNDAISRAKGRIEALKIGKEEKTLKEFMRFCLTQQSYQGADVVFGINRVQKCMEMKCVKKLVIVNTLEARRLVYRKIIGDVQKKREEYSKVFVDEEAVKEFTKKNQGKFDVVEDTLYLEWLADRPKKIVDIDVVSETTSDGMMFKHGFGGIGAYLHYRVGFEVFDIDDEVSDDDEEGEETEGEEEEDVDDFDDDPFGEFESSSKKKKKKKRKKRKKKKVVKEKYTSSSSSKSEEEEEEGEEEEKEGGEEEVHKTVIFAGNVDAGKSTVVGHLLQKAGQINERQAMQLKQEAIRQDRESWAIAYSLDTSEEEREKGKTVEVARVFFNSKDDKTGAKTLYTLLDAPGHRNYVPAMLECVSHADVVVMVVSARRNEFDRGLKGQCFEHALLAASMGAKKWVVAVNKMDMVQWSEESFKYVKTKMTNLLCKNLGIRKSNVQFVPISGIEGLNLLSQGESTPGWMDGQPCLMDCLQKISTKDNKKKRKKKNGDSGVTEFSVLDTYYDQRGGIMAIGKVMSGNLSLGDLVNFGPDGLRGGLAEVKKMKLQTKMIEKARCGDHIELYLSPNVSSQNGMDASDVLQKLRAIKPGHVITKYVKFKNKVSKAGEKVKATIQIVKKDYFLVPGVELMMHCHTSHTLARISRIYDDYKKKKNKKKNKMPTTGDQVRIKAELGRNVCVDAFTRCNWKGRFVLRDDTGTVAFGKIDKVF